jgi:hypothetical protein
VVVVYGEILVAAICVEILVVVVCVGSGAVGKIER